MFEKLEKAEENYNSLENRLQDSAVIQDQAEYTRLMKEYSYLTPVITKYRQYKKICSEMEQARQIMEQQDDELAELAKE